MPVIPPTGAQIYDNCTTILNSARFRLSSVIKTLSGTSGSILDETQASTQQAFNNAYRRLQDGLSDCGVRKFYDDITIFNIPATTNMDPASQCSISWFQIFDGTNYQTAPVLPSTLITPLWMSERPSVSFGSVNPFPFPNVDRPNMRQMTDGLDQSYRKQQRNGQWEWRNDAIYYPGAIIPVDFRIRFRSYLTDIDNIGDARWWNTTVPIMRCQDALSKWLCFEFATARAADGDAMEQMMAVAAGFKEEAIEATMLMGNRDVNAREDVRRIPYGGGSRGQGGSGYGGWNWG